MKISKSKKELARIISENGGWRDVAEWAAQDKNADVTFFLDTPWRCDEVWEADNFEAVDGFRVTDMALKNWHQTILSRAEYFFLYQEKSLEDALNEDLPDADGRILWNGGECPVDVGTIVDVKHRGGDIGIRCHAGMSSSEPDGDGPATAEDWAHLDEGGDIIAYRLHKPEKAKPELCESVMRSIPEPAAKPTIEQLAADYRNAKDYAERKQQEADDAKADAEAKLAELAEAGKAIGLLFSPITAKQEHELVAAVKVGDEVECVESNTKRDKYNGMVGRLHTIDESDTSTPYLVDFGGNAKIWCHEVKFIRRP